VTMQNHKNKIRKNIWQMRRTVTIVIIALNLVL